MSEMLSQAEIDALLNGTNFADKNSKDDETLTSEEIDALGEVGNISMGTSATTLFTLLGQKVTITTPKVTISSWEEIARERPDPCVAVRVEYTNGLVGSNVLILNEKDVKVITDLMMGGEGNAASGELSELHLSAISEAMNQMIGSAATSMSSMLSNRIDISPPEAFMVQLDSEHPFSEFDQSQKIVVIAFRMVVGSLIDSQIMQLIPLPFAKNLADVLLGSSGPQPAAAPRQHEKQPVQAPEYIHNQNDLREERQQVKTSYNSFSPENTPSILEPHGARQGVNVQPAQFQTFDDGMITVEKKNISLIMEVPLEITVELGRTQKMIKEILEFSPGSIIELDKLAGEPVDILVNGKKIAKGEVVVIDESFGVRVTDIIDPAKRL